MATLQPEGYFMPPFRKGDDFELGLIVMGLFLVILLLLFVVAGKL